MRLKGYHNSMQKSKLPNNRDFSNSGIQFLNGLSLAKMTLSYHESLLVAHHHHHSQPLHFRKPIYHGPVKDFCQASSLVHVLVRKQCFYGCLDEDIIIIIVVIN